MSQAWIGLGSNLDDPAAHLRQAFVDLHALPETACLRQSGLYRSAPVGPQDQPDFCNAVAELRTGLAPQALLQALQGIEDAHARQRTRRWGPRSLDLDLLLYDDLVLDTTQLQVPHPRLHERAFVLQPLASLAPQLQVPGESSVAELLAALPPQRIGPWEPAKDRA